MISGNREGLSRKENAGTAAEPPVIQCHQVSESQVAPAIMAQRIVNCQPVTPAFETRRRQVREDRDQTGLAELKRIWPHSQRKAEYD
jgi:hypothetical protein